MPIGKYFGFVGSALLALLFVSNALFGEEESRFDGSLYQSSMYQPRFEEVAAPERRFTHDVTPANRVKEVFAQFVPNENKRKRYSSAGTAIY